MEIVERLLLDVLCIIEHVSVCYAVLKQPWKTGGGKKGMFGLLISFFLYFSSQLTVGEMGILQLLVVFVFFYSLFEMPFSKTAAVCAVSVFMTALLENTVFVLQTVYLSERDKIQTVMAVIVLVWLYHFVIGRKLEKEFFQLPLSLWWMMGGILFILTFSLVFQKFAIIMLAKNQKVFIMGNALVCFTGVAVCGLMLAMVYYFNRTASYRSRKETAEHYNEQQKEYFGRLLEKEQATRQFRHDITGHLLAVGEMCRNGDSEKAGEYVNTLLAEVSSVSKAQYDVGNEIVNVIINYYFSPLKGNCAVHVSGYMGEETGILSNDLCVLVSNLVKNAVEAVMQLPEEKREIRFAVARGRDYLHIGMENTCTGSYLCDKNGKLKTTKRDAANHGYGMKSIEQIIRKYQGRSEVQKDSGKFTVEIYLKVG